MHPGLPEGQDKPVRVRRAWDKAGYRTHIWSTRYA
jgi:hypothetical protein